MGSASTTTPSLSAHAYESHGRFLREPLFGLVAFLAAILALGRAACLRIIPTTPGDTACKSARSSWEVSSYKCLVAASPINIVTLPSRFFAHRVHGTTFLFALGLLRLHDSTGPCSRV